jgi:hypothetical protein
MRLRTALTVATLFLFCFNISAWSTPVPDRLVPASSSALPDNPSLSGKIASVSDAAFSLEVIKNQDRKVIEFLVDGDTKVEGKLAVGSQATVEYRTNGGNNVAVRVVVTPSSGIANY